MRLLLHWVVSALAIGVAAYLVPGVSVTPWAAFVAALVLGALNLLVRPFILLLTLPINILTLGLFSFVINAALILLTARLVPGFMVSGFLSALIFALVLMLVHWVFHAVTED